MMVDRGNDLMEGGRLLQTNRKSLVEVILKKVPGGLHSSP